MKKFLLFFVLSVAASANAQIELGSDLGLYAGAGLAYQNGKISSNYDYQQAGFVFDVGVVYKQCVELDVDFSLASNTMLSMDVNGRTSLGRNLDLLYGAGYGFVFYESLPCGVEVVHGTERQVTETGSIDWPHVNIGILYPIGENMDLRFVGAVGYSDGVRYVGEEKNWHFISQIKAVAVWNF